MSSGKGLGFGIDDVAPVQIATGQTQHQHLRRGQIAGIGDVVLVAQAIDVGDVLIGGLVAGIVEAVASEMIWPVVAVAHRVCWARIPQ